MNQLPTMAAAPSTPADQHESGARTWARQIRGGGQIIETCPAWCTDSHHLDVERASSLDDLTHGDYFDGPELPVFDAEQGTAPVQILAGRINIDPYSENPKRRTPHIHFEPFMDEVMECLGPDEFGAVIAQIRAHCDRLDEVHAQLLQVRAEWPESTA
ncbi:DUF6907 domain-containing protein [Streptomyces meridianus]|uniref:Uncharacterized protein n=1 Tax=Streptomyces meridianus TaxID=2938945 RepID=A0ABT0XAI2_9ACTN|nr:hypothetical protein [Streptomyces meridianus]MCM2579517.1 hypothetical protein [Streptomyces meridianus]